MRGIFFKKQNTFSLFAFIIILSMLLLVLNNCGGGASSGSASVSSVSSADTSLDNIQTGSFRAEILWPERAGSKLIPSDTQQVVFTVSGQGLTTERTERIVYGTTTVTFEELPVGTKTAEVKAINGEGTTLAHRIVDFVVSSGQTATSSIILGVSITSTGYIPQNITISANDTLYWVNSDSTGSHQIISVGGKFTNSGSLAYGQSYNYQFTTVDTCEYYDNGNHTLRGSVIVEAEPYIDSLIVSTGTVGTAVTINGGNFGSSQGTSTVTFNGITASNITSWSSTQIQCTVPAYATSGNVVATVGGQASNGISFTMNTPSITTLSIDTGIVGASVTITGTNFGSAQGSSTVTFNGVSASITSWSNTQIVCTVPSCTTGDVVVTVAGNASDGSSFTPATGWTAQTSGVSGWLNGIIFTDANNGWATGTQDCLRTTNGGTNWTTVYSIGGATFYTIYALNNLKAWAGGSKENCYYTTDGGSNWTGVWVNTYHITTIFMINENIGWLACNDYGQTVKRTGGAGTSWSNVYDAGSYRIKSIHAENVNQVWGVGTSGRIIYSSNSGSSWTVQTSGTAYNLYSVWFTDTSNGWAVGEAGTIIHTIDGGSNWASQTSGTNECLYGVCFVDSSHGWAVGGGGTVIYTTDGGTTWTAQASGTVKSLRSVSFVDITHGWVSGESGTILYYY
ncbi:MAG: IPT/TIG domain-containing protein [Armatimonadota bacterium]